MTRIELKDGRTGEFGKRISLNIDKIASISELSDWDENEMKDDPRVHCRVRVPDDNVWFVFETYDEVMKKIEEAEEAEEKEGDKS